MTRPLFPLLAALLLLGASGCTSDCGPDNCDGCCDAEGSCIEAGSTSCVASGCDTECSGDRLFPDAPNPSESDRALLALCPSTPGVAVSAEAIRGYFAAHIGEAPLSDALRAAGKAGDVDWLTGLFVADGKKNAFTHIFCGDDWLSSKIGGLHFRPRYAQLEAEGKLCFDGPVESELQVGGEYLVKFHGAAPWSCGKKSVGGFPVDRSGLDTLAVAVRAYTACCEVGGQRKGGGVFGTGESPLAAWQIYCGTRNGEYGIDSMYPTDSRPSCGAR